jgi:CBS-domain-containing membrane protein
MPPTPSCSEREHPVLVSRRIHADGTYTLAFHVHCDARDQAVPLEACFRCGRCSEIRSEATGTKCWVRCTPPAKASGTQPLKVGEALEEGAVAADENLPIRDVVALFAQRGLHLLILTDAAGRVSGLVREPQVLPYLRMPAATTWEMAQGAQPAWHEPARTLMSSAQCVEETTTLRHALGLMAEQRERQVVVINPEGMPVGTLWDVDAMHRLFARAEG